MDYRPAPFAVQAAITNNLEIFKIVLGEGASTTESGFIAFTKKKNLMVSNALGAACHHFKAGSTIALYILNELDEDQMGVNFALKEFKDTPDLEHSLSKPGKVELAGATPVMLAINAVGDDALQLVKALYRKKADFSVVDLNGNTVLHYIAKRNSVKIFEFLKDNVELDFLARNHLGDTPFSLADKSKNSEILSLF